VETEIPYNSIIMVKTEMYEINLNFI